MALGAFEHLQVRMERVFAMRVLAPREDVDRIMESVCRIVPVEARCL